MGYRDPRSMPTPPTPIRRRPRRPIPPTPDQRADALFLSLLDDAQRADWERTLRCWVDTPRGRVRLGRLHDLPFRPTHAPDEEWSLCVVPTGRPMPMGDVWTNLLLVLAADPEAFFRAANVRKRRRLS